MRRFETHKETFGAHKKTKEKVNIGLCSTCNSIKTCTGRKNWKAPVLYCEEFCDLMPVKIEKGTKPESLSIESSPASVPTEKNEILFKGLCMNCENRHNCNFNRPESGVWHCEEYR